MSVPDAHLSLHLLSTVIAYVVYSCVRSCLFVCACGIRICAHLYKNQQPLARECNNLWANGASTPHPSVCLAGDYIKRRAVLLKITKMLSGGGVHLKRAHIDESLCSGVFEWWPYHPLHSF